MRYLISAIGLAVIILLQSACGFHLRGVGSSALPPELLTMQIRVEDQKLGGPIKQLVKQRLQVQSGVTIVENSATAPVLTISSETINRRVIAVSADRAKVNEYLLNYQLGYRLDDANGKVLLAPQVVALQQDFTFDSLNVLAKEREEETLRLLLREQAVQRVIHKLSSLKLKN